jgi:hypothetical protein
VTSAWILDFDYRSHEVGDGNTLLTYPNPDHADKMTHFQCLGLELMPNGTTWLCRQCGGGSDPTQLKIPGPQFLNLQNLGQTCYMFSSVQCLFMRVGW